MITSVNMIISIVLNIVLRYNEKLDIRGLHSEILYAYRYQSFVFFFFFRKVITEKYNLNRLLPANFVMFSK